MVVTGLRRKRPMAAGALILGLIAPMTHATYRGECVDTQTNCWEGCWWYLRGTRSCGKGCHAKVCFPVGAGYYSPYGDDERYPCPAGTYSASEYGEYAEFCDACPSGTYNELQGQANVTSCSPCTPGYNGTGATAFFLDEDGQEVCVQDEDMLPSTTPSQNPTMNPSQVPTTSKAPSYLPSTTPSTIPSMSPTSTPSNKPSSIPSSSPSDVPTDAPSDKPSGVPTGAPSNRPSDVPTDMPSVRPSDVPTDMPSVSPSGSPSLVTSARPSHIGSDAPSASASPSSQPVVSPSDVPSHVASLVPSAVPSSRSSSVPSNGPSSLPSASPSTGPSSRPLSPPSYMPSALPSDLPSGTPSGELSDAPSSRPSNVPSASPSSALSGNPSDVPSSSPSTAPSELPSEQPSTYPSVVASGAPSEVQTNAPSFVPTNCPSEGHSSSPSSVPTESVSLAPSVAHSSVPSSIQDNLLFGANCAEGYAGADCTECCDTSQLFLSDSDGRVVENPACVERDESGQVERFLRYYREENGKCTRCPKFAWTFSLAAGLGTMLAAGAWSLPASSKGISPGMVYVATDYVQCLSFLGTTRVPWPSLLKDMFRAVAVMNFDMNSISPPDCAFRVTYEEKATAFLVLPVAFLLLVVFVNKALGVFKQKYLRQHREKAYSHTHIVVGLLVTLFFFAYLKVHQTVVEALGCAFSRNKSLHSVSSEGLLFRDRSWLCYSGSDSGKLSAPAIGAAAFALYSVGFPTFVSFVLFRQKNKWRANADQISARSGRLENTTEGNLLLLKFRQRYGSLYCMYKPKFWYWSLTVLARKFLLALSGLLFENETVLQMGIIAIIYVISAISQWILRPHIGSFSKGDSECAGSVKESRYRSGADCWMRLLSSHNSMEVLAQMSFVLVTLFGMLFTVQDEGSFIYMASSFVAAGTVAVVLFLVILTLWLDICRSLPRVFVRCRRAEEHMEEFVNSEEAILGSSNNSFASMTTNEMLEPRKEERGVVLATARCSEVSCSESEESYSSISDSDEGSGGTDSERGAIVPALEFGNFRIEDPKQKFSDFGSEEQDPNNRDSTLAGRVNVTKVSFPTLAQECALSSNR